ncbi:cell division control protein 6 homolog [Euwallacea similis]|uniref:cell division control protein 6 homolog n=1 Tax=Euwallacea similis TaxID=1736056 RepID=UPI00344F4AC8
MSSKIGTHKTQNMRVTRASARQSSIPEETVKSHPCRRTPIISTRSESENGTKFQNVHRTPTKQKAVQSDLHQLSPVTPPKQLKQDSEKSVLTPSTLFKTLTLTSPSKNESSKTSKRPLFNQKSPKDNCSEEENFAVNEAGVKATLNYQNARRALHSNFPTDMPGREKEIEEIKEFIQGHLEEKSSGSIYISGPPGTGKTASLNLILESEYILSQVHKIYINCTAIKSATAVYSRLNKELHVKETGKSEKENLSAFENYLKKKHKPILIVLDEIDQLETKNHSILYTIFEWPSRLNSKLILIGIANALDLTDRMLPRLQARCELKPQLLHFAPYTKEQIVNIFTSRLKAAGVLEVFSPVAIQMLAAKVASISGDVRRALDIGRRVVELVDGNKKGDIFKSVENFTNELAKDETTKKVNLKEIVNILNNVYGTSQNLTEDSEDTIPLQQKIIVCSLLLMLKKVKNKDITVGKLHEIYSRVCSKRNLSAVDQAEFVGLCSLIETRGIIRLSGKKEPRQYKVVLEWNENEVSEALKDKQLMSSILQDDPCVGRN